MIALLNTQKDRSKFDCGNSGLNRYFQQQGGSEIGRRATVCFAMTAAETGLYQGFYTLSTNSIQKAQFPGALQNKLPPYPSVPTILLGRLAVNKAFQGQRFGHILLMDALKRSHDISKQVGAFAVVVDPADNAAERFYKNQGFTLLPDSRKMFIAMKTLEKLFG